MKKGSWNQDENWQLERGKAPKGAVLHIMSPVFLDMTLCGLVVEDGWSVDNLVDIAWDWDMALLPECKRCGRICESETW